MPGEMEEVIRVPGEHRSEFMASGCEEHIRIENDEEEDGWEVPEDLQLGYLRQFLLRASIAKSWTVGDGIRMGYNQAGLYLQENHHKRFYGILRENASIFLRKACPEALPKFNFGFAHQALSSTDSTDNLLSKLLDKMPTISDEMRDQVLLATFKAADSNDNEVLSRPEMGTLMRKIVGTISAKQVEEMMAQADTNGNDMVSYAEYVRWLRDQAPPEIAGKIKRSLKTEADIVRASFRAWDGNGDGLISKKEVHFVMKKHCKDIAPSQVDTLIKTIDSDHDGKIDYDEFIDFLFYSTKK